MLVHDFGDQINLGAGDIVRIVAAQTLSGIGKTKLTFSGTEREDFGSPAGPKLVHGLIIRGVNNLRKRILSDSGLQRNREPRCERGNAKVGHATWLAE